MSTPGTTPTTTSEHLAVAAYVRTSTTRQDDDRQVEAIKDAYGDHSIDWFADVGESGGKKQREEYQRLRDEFDNYDVVVAHELDRLGRSFAELANFVEEIRSSDTDIDLVSQPVGTMNQDSWMEDMMLNLMMVFADAERRMITDRVQQGIERAKEEGKRIGRPPFGYDVDSDGYLQQKPDEYARAQQFITEVKKGRAKRPTAEFFDIPESSIDSILERSEKNYDIQYDDDEWEVERAKVKAGEKELEPLGDD